MARKGRFRLCKICGSPHNRMRCPLADLNDRQELAAAINGELISLGLTPAVERQIAALRRDWKKERITQITSITQITPIQDLGSAVNALRQAWGARA